MSGFMYPGIWGVLQPVIPNVQNVTSVVYPTDIADPIPLPTPYLGPSSALKLNTFLPNDPLNLTKPLFTGDSTMTVTIAYKTIQPVDQLSLVKPMFTADSWMAPSLVLKTYTFTDPGLQFPIPTITPGSSLIVTVSYKTHSYSDPGLQFPIPSLTAGSSLS